MEHQQIKLEDTIVGKALEWITVDKVLTKAEIDGKIYNHNLTLVDYVKGGEGDSDKKSPDAEILKEAIKNFIEKVKFMVGEGDILHISTGAMHIVQCPPLSPERRYVIYMEVLGSVSQTIIDFKYNMKKSW